MPLLFLANAPLLIGVAAGVGLGICVLLFWRQAQTVDSLQKSVQRLQRAQKDAHADVRQRLESSTEAQRSLQGRLQALGQSDARIAEVASLVQALDKEVRDLASRVEQSEGAGQGVQAVLSSLRADAQAATDRIEAIEANAAKLEAARAAPPPAPQPRAAAETEIVHATRGLERTTAPTADAASTAVTSSAPAPVAPQPHPGDGRAAIAAEEEEPSGTGIYILLFVLVGLAMLAQCVQMGT